MEHKPCDENDTPVVRMLRPRRALSFWGSAAGAVLADQVTKLIARAFLHDERPVRLIPGFFDLRLSYNSGAAFGVMPDWAPLFITIGLVAVFAIVRLGRTGAGSRVLAAGLGLLLGGAIGNLIDRLVSRTHEVTDFLSMHVTIGGRTYAWPTFNVADIAIVSGVVLVLFYVYVVGKGSGERRAES